MGKREFKVVYNSDLIIRDRSELASLCAFYDKVLLPFRGDFDGVIPGVGDLNYEKVNIRSWELENGTLFDEGVLSRLPPHEPGYKWQAFATSSQKRRELVIYLKPENIPDDASLNYEEGTDPYFSCQSGWRTALRHQMPEWGEILPSDVVLERQRWKIYFFPPHSYSNSDSFVREVEKVRVSRTIEQVETTTKKVAAIPQEQISAILAMPVRTIRVGDKDYIAADLAAHLTRTDINLPQIFASSKGQPIGRDILVALEAEAVFKYLLPKIHICHPTQILELREKIAETREGFTMHLWKLSKGLEEHARDGTSVSEIAEFARNLIETELIPDYREFRRQIAAIKAGKWEKFLDAAGKIVEIDAAPWTPKFWGLLLKALGLSFVTAAGEQQEVLSNKYQAFKFMSEVESGR
jgi:hypothetical protein